MSEWGVTLPCCVQSIMTGLAGNGVSCQYTVIKDTAEVETGGVMAEVTCLDNIPGVRMRVQRRIFPGYRQTVCRARTIMTA